MGIECGSGVIGELPEALAADDFVLMLKRTFDVECVQCNQLLRRPIKTVAICGGAGSFLLPEQLHREPTPLSQVRCTIMSISAMSRKYRLPSLATIRANSILTKYLNQ